MNVLALLALVLMLVVIVPASALAGLWEVASGRSTWPRLVVRTGTRLSGLVKLAVSTVVLCLPVLAIPMAESRTGWVDEDGDGILDGYRMTDWIDVNGSTFVAVWVLAAAPLVLGAFLVGRRLDRASTAST